jgi:hypothetical protein
VDDEASRYLQEVHDTFMTVEEASERIGMRPLAIRSKARSGKIRAFKIFGVWLLDRSSVDSEAKRRQKQLQRLQREHAERERLRVTVKAIGKAFEQHKQQHNTR